MKGYLLIVCALRQLYIQVNKGVLLGRLLTVPCFKLTVTWAKGNNSQSARNNCVSNEHGEQRRILPAFQYKEGKVIRGLSSVSTTPWGHTVRQSRPRHQRKVIRQLHATLALPRRESPQYPSNRRLSVLQGQSARCGVSLASAENRTLVFHPQPVAIPNELFRLPCMSTSRVARS
jgi:hypothetical protein